MVFNATFDNISVISWRSVLLGDETVGTGENQWHVASHWQILSHYVVHLAQIELTTSVVISTDCIGSCKSNYHTITATTALATIYEKTSFYLLFELSNQDLFTMDLVDENMDNCKGYDRKNTNI